MRGLAVRTTDVSRNLDIFLTCAVAGVLGNRFGHAFSEDEARAQLDTTISWGRYGERFDYDAPSGELRLDLRGRDIGARQALEQSSA